LKDLALSLNCAAIAAFPSRINYPPTSWRLLTNLEAKGRPLA
jgi:hypothetical protein